MASLLPAARMPDALPFGLTRQEAQRMLRFGCVGAWGVAVNSLVLWLLAGRAHLALALASAIATEVAILNNFALNHAWTFAGARDSESALVKLAKFNLVALGGLVLTVAALWTLTHGLGLHYLLANLLAVAAGTGVNYSLNRRWTWNA